MRTGGLTSHRGDMKRTTVCYAIYTRQSTSDEGKVLSSCDVQFKICRDFVQAQADSSWKWISRRFDDVGFSGADTDRPALQRLLTHIRNHDVDKVVVYRLDRLTRRLVDSVEILRTFREAGVELLIVTAPELGSAATDKLLLNVMATFAEFERDMIRSRLADMRSALKRHGRRLAGPPPYGYDGDPRTKQLVVNPAEARRVKAMFKAAAPGPSGAQEPCSHRLLSRWQRPAAGAPRRHRFAGTVRAGSGTDHRTPEIRPAPSVQGTTSGVAVSWQDHLSPLRAHDESTRNTLPFPNLRALPLPVARWRPSTL